MLQLHIEGGELFDESTSSFIDVKSQTISLEHSLLSISKWESKWKKSFLWTTDMTPDEAIDYVRCMTVTSNVDPLLYKFLNNEHIDKIQKYIDDPMTATTFAKQEGSPQRGRQKITAEVIYYWMIALNIPFECQKWHLNRLLTLIRVCDIKNSPKKKRSKNAFLKDRSALNAQRLREGNGKR